MKNRLVDMHNLLFAQLEKLADEDLSPMELGMECQRARAMTGIACTILEEVKITVEVSRLVSSEEIDEIPDHIIEKKKPAIPGIRRRLLE